MGARSSIKKLPPGVKAELDRLLRDDRLTHRQIVEHMRGLGASVSKSAVGRYAQGYTDFLSDIRFAREALEHAGTDLADLPTLDKGRLLAESLQALIIRARMQLGEGTELDIEEVSLLARAVKDVAGALKTSVDTDLKVREKTKLLASAADAAAKAATERGLSSDTVDAIREQILGVRA